MRLIKADALRTVFTEKSTENVCGAELCKAIISRIDEIPTVDAVPVIRCKDCKYYREDGDCWHEWDNDGRIYYQSVINEPNPDDYCSRAERKEE